MCKRLKLKPALLVLCLMFSMNMTAYGQTPFTENSVVRQKCSACHKLDQQGRVEVIEETRKTPEEWKVVVYRMTRINGAPLDDAEFNPVIKELSKYLCLTPEEMKKVAYLNSDENSQYVEKPRDDLEKRIFTACVRCHTYGKIASHRMTSQQWTENRNLHLGYYPTVVPQMREMDWPKESQELVEPLSKLFPFDDPAWQAWMKERKDQDLTGEWKVAGYQPGAGYYEGTYTFKANPQKGEDEYLIEREIHYQNGVTFKMNGEGSLYAGYHLRYAMAPTAFLGKTEGVFDLDTAGMDFEGKWWTVVQDSNAFGNEKFARVDNASKVLAFFPQSLKADSELGQELTLIGVNLPETLSEADIQFSDSGVKVEKLERVSPSKILCKVKVDSKTPTGPMKLSVKGTPGDESVLVFDKVDGIRIFPHLGRARVSSGAAYPPQGVQFVARAVNYGKDGKPDTEDDLILEPIEAKWGLEEESTRENDDDLKYLEAPIVNGLYTPVTTYGPIESRSQRQEGVGLIAVGASYTEGSQEFKSRALLAVTVPDFITHIK